MGDGRVPSFRVWGLFIPNPKLVALSNSGTVVGGDLATRIRYSVELSMARNGIVNFRINSALRFLDGNYLCLVLSAFPSDFCSSLPVHIFVRLLLHNIYFIYRVPEGLSHGVVLVVGNAVQCVIDPHTRITVGEKQWRECFWGLHSNLK